MKNLLLLPKFTFGVGDRFGQEGRAQLKAFLKAREQGIHVHPVWNKSNREHLLIGSAPKEVREEATDATQALAWNAPYFVDADHINLKTVAPFVQPCDFFTLDVAEYIGKPCPPDAAKAFLGKIRPYLGQITIPGISTPFELTESFVQATADKFLFAVLTAGEIHRYIVAEKGTPFATEISVDETDAAQSPAEIFLILAMIAFEQIPIQTIAPKFTGQFNKGVDYVGNLAQFEVEFESDLNVIAYAIKEFGLPANLKLSVHSGSDKFSLYPIINRLLCKYDCGLHVKTAGTTWLEEMIGLAESGGEGLELAKAIYVQALGYYDELTRPYASVININPAQLPSADTVAGWTSAAYVRALRHDPTCAEYQPQFRQLIHVSFKLAAKMGSRYREALKANRATIEENVTHNIWVRHLQPIFSGTKS